MIAPIHYQPHNLTAEQALCALQDNGVVSVLCVCLGDVAYADEAAAIAFLKDYRPVNQTVAQ